jgi:hypothetical protein
MDPPRRARRFGLPRQRLKTTDITAMKTIAITIIAVCLTSCAGVNLSAITPWGDVQSIDGATVITAKPVVIPSRK